MANFVIKESSIKDEANLRTLSLIKTDLLKFLKDVNFNLAMRQGNYAYWESNNFTMEDFNLGMDGDKLQVFLDNTLNFRYENFKVVYTK